MLTSRIVVVELQDFSSSRRSSQRQLQFRPAYLVPASAVEIAPLYAVVDLALVTSQQIG